MSKVDVIIYDQYKSWSPKILASGDSGRGVGGWEVMMVQLAEGLARQGLEVEAHTARNLGKEENGVRYPWLKDASARCRVLITGRDSKIPDHIRADRVFTACVDDPTHSPRKYDHLRGRTTMVHVSQWQRSLYAALGHGMGIVIPSMISDWIYDWPIKNKVADRWICVNAWNKGTDATLEAWRKIKPKGHLIVGSAYGFPPDAFDRCARAGAKWIGLVTPHDVVTEIAKAQRVFRVCTAPETFGVADAIAEIVGTMVHCLCVNGTGAATEVLEGPYLTESEDDFARDAREPIAEYVPPRKDLRESTLIAPWLDAIGESF